MFCSWLKQHCTVGISILVCSTAREVGISQNLASPACLPHLQAIRGGTGEEQQRCEGPCAGQVGQQEPCQAQVHSWRKQLWESNPFLSCQHQGKEAPQISNSPGERGDPTGGQPRESLPPVGGEQKMPLVDFFCETCAKPWLVGWWDQVIGLYWGL